MVQRPDLLTLVQTDWERSQLFYSSQPSKHIGRYILGTPSAEQLPIDASHLLKTALDTVGNSPDKAHQWASTFGKLSIAITGQYRPDSFTIEPATSHIPPYATELKTNYRQLLRNIMTGRTDHDASRTYLILDNPETISPEMAIIQLLHLVDTDLITKQLVRNEQPILRLIDSDMLAKLRHDNPDILLRLYGNVRQAAHTPTVLGTVAPTGLLEKLRITTEPLTLSPPIPIRPSYA